MKPLNQHIKERLLINKNINVVDSHYPKDTDNDHLRFDLIYLKK